MYVEGREVDLDDIDELLDCARCEDGVGEIEMEANVIGADDIPTKGAEMVDFHREYNLLENGESPREVHGYKSEWIKVRGDTDPEDVAALVEHGITEHGFDTRRELLKAMWDGDKKTMKRMLLGLGVSLGSIGYLVIDPEISGKEEILLDGEPFGLIGGGLTYAYFNWKHLDHKYHPDRAYAAAKEDALENYYVIDTDYRLLSDGQLVRKLQKDGLEYVSHIDGDLRTFREDLLEEDCKYLLAVSDPSEHKEHLKNTLDQAFIDGDFHTYDDIFEDGLAHGRNGCPPELVGRPYQGPPNN